MNGRKCTDYSAQVPLNGLLTGLAELNEHHKLIALGVADHQRSEVSALMARIEEAKALTLSFFFAKVANRIRGIAL